MTTLESPVTPKGRLGWMLFDCSTQPFYTLVTTFVFAPFFAAAVAASPAEGQSLWGYATAAAGLIIALTAPILGSIADVVGPRKPWIAVFGLMLVAGSSMLWFVVPGDPSAVMLALVGFAIATIGVEYATVFNNAMMPHIAPPEELGRLSGTGWAIGYIGGLVSLVIVLGFIAADPVTGQTILGFSPLFGLDPALREGDRASGPISALWFILFVLPMFLFTPDVTTRTAVSGAVRRGVSHLSDTLRHLPEHREAAKFLAANMLYTDALIALFAFGGVYAAGVFSWTTIEIGIFGILLTITGTIGALVGGRLDDRIGPKKVVLGSLVILIAMGVGILSLSPDRIFFVIPALPALPGDGLFASLPEQVYLALGAIIGLAAGPVQAASRTLLVRLAPPEKTTQFFGLFALTGKITSFVGPLAVGIVTQVTDSQRLGVIPLIVLFVIGGAILLAVRLPATQRR